MSETQVSLSTAEELGLLPEEVDRIEEVLGRRPNPNELKVFAVMWGEACSCKNSMLQLRTLPLEGEKGAGLVDLGNGYAVAFNMKSQLAASGNSPEKVPSRIAGMHRDILSKGARPIASLSTLCLGELELPESQHLLKDIRKGIGDYGNAMGVAAVAGDLYVNSSYNDIPLLSAFSIGILKKDAAALSPKSGIGNSLYIVGQGSAKPDESGTELVAKRLLESSLEGLQSGAIVAIRHLGLGGITSATAEMAAEGKIGMNIWVEKIPAEKEDILPFERLVQDSEEGVLFELEKGREKELLEILDKLGLSHSHIGETTDSGNLRYHMDGELMGEIPVDALVQGGGAPVYEREQKEPAYMAELRDFDPNLIIEPIEHDRVIRHLLAHIGLGAKKWLNTSNESPDEAGDEAGDEARDAALLNIAGMKTGILLSSGCNSRYVQADPEKGAMLAVAKAARNIACTGGTPRAASNSLNFGNPYNPEVYYQFAHAIKGMGNACQQFNTPISGGNVSLYNESESGQILPTPLIGMLGTLEDSAANAMSMHFKTKGDQIYLLGKAPEDFGSSEYVYSYHQKALSPAPYINLAEEQQLQEILRELIVEKSISSAHNVSEGGLIISLLESAFVKEMGFSLRCPEGIRKDAFLYGEAGGRVIVSVSTAQLAKFVRITSRAKVDALHLGTVAGEHMVIDGEKMDEIRIYKRLYQRSLEKKLGFSLLK